MIIAILDNGICKEEILTEVNTYCIGNAITNGFVQKNPLSHATICAKIIEKYCKPDKLIDIVFLGEDGTANMLDLCLALELCLSLNVDVINLSSGIDIYNADSDDYRRLLAVCRQLYVKGIKIYAAQSNSGRLTIPANFPYTISVEQINPESNLLCALYRRSDVYTKGNHAIQINGKRIVSWKCNSYACAYAVSQVEYKKNPIRNRIFLSGLFSSDVQLYAQKIQNIGTDQEYRTLFLDRESFPAHVYLEKVSCKQKRTLKKKGVRFLSLSITSLKKQYIKKCAGSYPNVDIPIVSIKKSEGSIALAKQLMSQFFEIGYNSSILSTNKNDFFEGFVYVPADILNSYIKFFSFFNKSDILFVIIDGDMPIQNDDVLITMHQNGYTVHFQKQSIEIQDLLGLVNAIESIYE